MRKKDNVNADVPETIETEPMVDEISDVIAEKGFKSSIWFSVLGAFVGAFVSVIPAVVCVLLFQYIHPLMFFAGPMCVGLFMTIFRKPQLKQSIIILVVLSLLAFYLTQNVYVTYLYTYYSGQSMWMMFAYFFYMLFDVSIWSAFAQEPIYTYIFFILGLAIAFEVFFWPKKAAVAKETDEKSDETADEEPVALISEEQTDLVSEEPEIAEIDEEADDAEFIFEYDDSQN